MSTLPVPITPMDSLAQELKNNLTVANGVPENGAVQESVSGAGPESAGTTKKKNKNKKTVTTAAEGETANSSSQS